MQKNDANKASSTTTTDNQFVSALYVVMDRTFSALHILMRWVVHHDALP